MNKVKCLKCNKELVSSELHDYVVCDCGNVSVKGGVDHMYAFSKDLSSFEYKAELSSGSQCKEDCEKKFDEKKPKISKDELFDVLEAKIRFIEHIPNKHSFS